MLHICRALVSILDAAMHSICEECGTPIRPNAYRKRGHASLHSQSLAESYIILCSITLQQRPAKEQGMHEPSRDSWE